MLKYVDFVWRRELLLRFTAMWYPEGSDMRLSLLLFFKNGRDGYRYVSKVTKRIK